MKGYYLYFVKGDKNLNIEKKISMQVKEMSKISETKKIKIEKKDLSFFQKLMDRIPFVNEKTWDCPELNSISDADFIYIRRTLCNRNMLDTLKTLRNNNKTSKILLEVFTYPYDKDEFKGIKKFWPHFVREAIYRKQYKKYIDRIVTYSKDDSIFGIDTIKIRNGIDVDALKVVKHNDNGDVIHLLCLAMFRKHHGYERLIRGLWEYYREGNRKFCLHFVGDGPELPYYKQLVKTYKLENSVIFHNVLDGEELEKVYNCTDIAIDVLGLYKNGLHYASSLKTKEYLLKGLPIITACEEDVLESRPNHFYLSFPNNDSVINFDRIVEFYDSLYLEKNKDQVAQEIREFFIDDISMSKTFHPVIEYIKR